jgi:CheY-like chemotaxis protein
VELHGGTVRAESIGAGLGASFTVELPILAVADDTGSAVRSGERKKQVQQGGLSEDRLLQDLRILVVDDELDARQIIMTILQRSGADVRTAISVTAAMQTMDTWRPDVLISDIGLPVEDGYALIDRIRSRSAQQGGQIPALAVTAYARKEDRARILAAGYQLHVPKPVEPRELVKAIANLVGR